MLMNLATIGNQKKLCKIENYPEKIQNCTTSKISDAQELEERNRVAQRKKFQCDIPECKRKLKREKLESLGCCFQVSPKLKWAEDVPWDECYPCGPPCFKDVPLKRLKIKFKDAKEPKRICPEPEPCVRLDDGLKITPKTLPKIKPFDSCKPCLMKIPDNKPILPRLKKNYDDSKMKYPHVPCPPVPPPCTTVRLDDVCPIQYKELTKLKVPKECVPCNLPVPTICLPLRRLNLKFEDTPRICPPPEVCELPDQEIDYKTYKKLPKIHFGTCEPCQEVPTKTPKFKRLKRRFKDTDFKWIQVCEKPKPCAPRLDEGLKIRPKKLKKIKSNCLPCSPMPTFSQTKLKRPVKAYDDSKLEIKWNCPKEICDPHSRLDSKLRVKKKKLRTYTPGKCPECIVPTPDAYPPLRKLKRLFKDRDLPRDCPKPPLCDLAERMDGVIQVKPMVLPELPLSNCKPCSPFMPTICPKIIPLKPRGPILDRSPEHPAPDQCNVCPPRLDDICCVTPKAKHLPRFNPRMYPKKKKDDFDYCYEKTETGFKCCEPKEANKERKNNKSKCEPT